MSRLHTIFTNNKKVRRLVLLSTAILITLIAANVLFTYYNAVSTTRITVANHGVKMAEAIAASIDAKAYSEFLLDPTYTNTYWNIRNYLNDARQKLGALYVYTLKIDNREVSKGMIMGMPKEATGFDIGTVCTIPPVQVSQAFDGKTFISAVLDDPEHGQYVTVGAPIKDEQQQVIGYIGIDLSVEMLDDIKAGVIKNSISSFLYSVLFVIILIATYTVIHHRYQHIVKESVAETEVTYQREMLSFLTTVRSFRHDFFNHLHVINGLIEQEKFEQAQKYTRSLTKDIKLIEIAPQIENPALLVLLQTKWETAVQHNIDFHIDISDKSTYEQIQSTDLVKILSNLIDNAIEHALLMPKEDRMVQVVCCTQASYYYFEVINSGHPLSVQEKRNMFQEGYSTKRESGDHKRGYGLTIVAGTLERYKGEVAVESKEGLTIIRVRIPVSKKEGEA